MDFDSRVRTAIYDWIVERTEAPVVGELAGILSEPPEAIRETYGRLFRKRVLFLEPDGETIRMAPPFSGVATQHRVRVGDREYFANCSWDSLGIPAALHAPAEVFPRCEQTLARARGRPLRSPRREVVGRPGLHVKHDALLPVGRKGRRVVPGAGNPEAAHPHPRPALASRGDLVRESADSRGTPAAARRDAEHLRGHRPRGPLLGPAVRPVRMMRGGQAGSVRTMILHNLSYRTLWTGRDEPPGLP